MRLSILGFLAFLGSFPGLFSCSLAPGGRPADRITVASWNVENLFDEVRDGGEYPEFDPSQGWTRAQFWTRCDALARVVRTLTPGGPEVLVLQELENSHVLEVFRSRFLPDLEYHHWFLAPDSDRGVKTAVLSRYPFLRTGLLYPPGDDQEVLRPVIEVEIDLGGRSLIVLGNHWKSRIPTPAATEGLRRNSAQVVSRRIAALEARPELPFIVVLGDFNTSLELSRSRPDRALVPGGAFDGVEPGLVVFSSRTTAPRSHVAGAVWDPWELVSDPQGSYYYQGDWNRLDHAFVAVSSLRIRDWVVEGFRVVAYAPTPLAYGVRTPKGVSDHFPVVLTLSRGGS